MSINNKWDELDLLFNRAKLKNIDLKTEKKERLELLIELNEIFKKNHVTYFLNYPSNLIFENNYQRVLEENIVVVIDELNNLCGVLLNSGFEILSQELEHFYIRKNKRVLKIERQIEIPKLSEIRDVYYNNQIFKLIKPKKKKTKPAKSLLRKTKLNIKNQFFKKLHKSEFLKLQIESTNSKSWILRKSHLDLVTNNKENIRVEEIFKFFKVSNNLEQIQDKIIETNTSDVFEEPIYANKNFWNSGNNFFIYPLLFEFRKDIVAYKNANDYIKNNKKPFLYSKEYYETLTKMTDKEIELFLKKNPIEISNDSVISGKHRVFAMIGRLIRNQKYIHFYVKYV